MKHICGKKKALSDCPLLLMKLLTDLTAQVDDDTIERVQFINTHTVTAQSHQR